MQYDFSVLPTQNHKLELRAYAAVVTLLVGYVLAIVTSQKVLGQIIGVLLVLGIILFATYSWLQVRKQRKATTQFISANATEACTEEMMWSLVPPCFSWLSSDPELLDMQVANGYTYALSSDSAVAIFDFTYWLRKGDDKKVRQYSFTLAAFSAPEVFPHMYLDGKQNKITSSYDELQRLSLEGDFDDYFNLYVAENEGRNALMVFTPDVMQTLLDGGRPYDIELSGDSVTVIMHDNIYYRETCRSLFSFLNAFETELQEKPVDWDSTTVVPMLANPLQFRKASFAALYIWTLLGLVAAFVIMRIA